MLRWSLTVFACLGLVTEIAAAKKKGGRGKTVTTIITPEEAQAKASQKASAEEKKDIEKTELEPTAPSPATSGDKSAELEHYRAIQSRPIATVQDMVDVFLMYRGEFAKYSTPDSRMARARELKILKGYGPLENLRRGTLAYAIMQTYKPESGWIFWLTGWERYALRDTQEAEIMPITATPGQNLSGEQLLGTVTAAEEFVENRKDYRNKQ